MAAIPSFLGKSLLQLPIIGHDLDKSQGFHDIFSTTSHAWCIQHIKGRDKDQLRKLLADIYGTQNEVMLQNGLADASDEDFDAKLESLKDILEMTAPGFYE